jgi:hypothetical protein
MNKLPLDDEISAFHNLNRCIVDSSHGDSSTRFLIIINSCGIIYLHIFYRLYRLLVLLNRSVVALVALHLSKI